jgi:hypothetical protein
MDIPRFFLRLNLTFRNLPPNFPTFLLARQKEAPVCTTYSNDNGL